LPGRRGATKVSSGIASDIQAGSLVVTLIGKETDAMAYEPIENYGIIGDLHSVALVGMDGSIDWLCLPSFDSPSVFAAILDDEKGGRFKIAPTSDNVTPKQLYWPDTNVLITRFFTPEGVAEVTDYMPIGASMN
jgi:GH15 family glucan-1,4-alpha-glucosidase